MQLKSKKKRKLEDSYHAKKDKEFEDNFFISKKSSGLDKKRLKDPEDGIQDSEYKK